MLSIKNLTKSYQTTKSKTKDRFLALKGVSIDFPETGFVFLLGKSGSGKSTLLNCIGGLDSFDDGEIIIKGKSSKDFTQSDFDSYRNTFIGFIFQEYNILENFTVAKNLALAIELQGKKASKEEVERLLSQVEMLDYAKRKPNQLSGGQKQRVAIARALIKNPEIIMADEPTGALDSNTGKQVMDTLKELSKTKLVIVVSHDRDFAEKYGDRIIELKDGKVISDTVKTEIEAQKTQSGVSIVQNKYIHIKKGQELTSKDIQAISLMICNNSKNSDTFISLDSKSNKEIKRAEGITDDGNQETFVDTKPEDIKVKKYNPKDLKLIRSRLKFKDSFKMGASALKSKVWKLVFTIFLSFIAFTMFGVIDALSCWNRADSVYTAMNMTGQKTIKIAKQKLSKYGYFEQDKITDEDIKNISEKYPDYKINGLISGYEVINRFKLANGTYLTNQPQYYAYASYNDDSMNPVNKTYDNYCEGIIYLTNEQLDEFNLTLYKGRLPETNKEIAISKYFYDGLLYNDEEKKINSLDDIKVSYNNNDNYKVVGVVDDGVDLSTYATASASDFVGKKYQKEVYNLTTGGFSRLVFVSSSFYNKVKSSSSEKYYNIFVEGTPSVNSNYSYTEQIRQQSLLSVSEVNAYYTDYYTLVDSGEEIDDSSDINKNFQNSYLLTYKGQYFYTKETNPYNDPPTIDIKNSPQKQIDERFTISSLQDDEIIVPYSYIKKKSQDGSYLESQEQYIACEYVNANQPILKIYSREWDNDTNSYKTTVYKELKIVGLTNNYENIIVNDKLYDELNKELFPFTGYNGAIVKLTGGSSDKEFIHFIETKNANDEKFPIQTTFTQILDSLESTIMSVTKYLLYVAIAFAFFASLLLMNFISNSISYKKREIGVLRALGARGSDIFGIFFNESAIIAFINFVISALATIITCVILNGVFVNKLGLGVAFFNPSIRQILLILGISILSAFIASIIPVSRFSHKKPIDAINNR